MTVWGKFWDENFEMKIWGKFLNFQQFFFHFHPPRLNNSHLEHNLSGKFMHTPHKIFQKLVIKVHTALLHTNFKDKRNVKFIKFAMQNLVLIKIIFATSRHLHMNFAVCRPIRDHHIPSSYIWECEELTKNSQMYNDYAIFRLFSPFPNFFSETFFPPLHRENVYENLYSEWNVYGRVGKLGIEPVTNTIFESKETARCWKSGNIAGIFQKLL